MNLALDIISGACWSLAYLAAIVQGWKKQTWCIPKLAICQNFAWEFWAVCSRLWSNSAFNTAFAVQLVWLVLDIVIWLLWLLFDRKTKWQLVKNAVLFLGVFTIMYFLAYRASLWGYMAFIINAIMSALFLYRFSCGTFEWTSIFIAAMKLIGTLAATILNGMIIHSTLILWLGGLCLLMDSYYLVILLRKKAGRG